MDQPKPDLPKRKRLRLENFDYSTPGAYFVTICCDSMKLLFGTALAGEVQLNRLGQIAAHELQRIQHHHNVCVATFIVMPNHIHFVLFISPLLHSESLRIPGRPRSAPTSSVELPTLGSIVKLYKQAVTRAIRLLLDDPEYVVWQRGYYEHIVRDEDDLNTRRQYILNNPLRWSLKT